MKRNRRDRIEQMKRQIEARGGIIGISSTAPEWVTERFLQIVLDCPDCQAQGVGKKRPFEEH
ncbi:MAG TPA: hypothetical protein VM534_07110 [Thermoanaerobaculia bacterium]|nr:hypothetical protein [Thermoanaerobaculia bacterium]